MGTLLIPVDTEGPPSDFFIQNVILPESWPKYICPN